MEILAQNHANKCTTSHSDSGNGENLWWGYGSCSGESCATNAIQSWISENNSGNCPNRDGGPSCGHWTQIIWQDTKQVSVKIYFFYKYNVYWELSSVDFSIVLRLQMEEIAIEYYFF